MSQYFPNSYKPSGGGIDIKVDLSNYATKTDLKIYHMLMLAALKSNLASLKPEVDKLDKLTPVPNDLAKISNIVKNDVFEKTEYDKLVTKVDSIDTTTIVLKSTYGIDKSDAEKKSKLAISLLKNDPPATKIPDAKSLVKKTDLNDKITKIESKTT